MCSINITTSLFCVYFSDSDKLIQPKVFIFIYIDRIHVITVQQQTINAEIQY